jgi:hypothetical protein
MRTFLGGLLPRVRERRRAKPASAAESEDEIERCFAADPWTPSDMLRVKRVSRWEILLRRPD